LLQTGDGAIKTLNEEIIAQIEDIKGRLYKTAYVYLRSEADALEAVDEAIYRALKNIGQLREQRYFKTWITRILINVCKKELRRKKGEPLEMLEDECYLETFDKLPIKEAIARLPGELSLIISLRYFSEYTLAETAEILELPQGTVATRQRKALSLLKLELMEVES